MACIPGCELTWYEMTWVRLDQT